MTTSDNRRAPRRSRGFWLNHTRRWKQSGLSKIAYCQEHNLKPVSFYNWSKKFDNGETENQSDSGPAPKFLPVQFDQSSSVRDNLQFVHVERAATDIALPVNLTSEQMKHWLQAIHALYV